MNFITIIDHFIVSGSRFLIGILLARFLGLEEFGLYALLWTIVVFSSSMQIPLTITPMMQIGAGKQKPSAENFFTICLALQVSYHAISIPFVSLMSLWILWGNPQILATLLVINIYVICYNQYEFFRRYFYATGQNRFIVLLDFALYLSVGAILAILHFRDVITITNYLLLASIPAAALSAFVYSVFPNRRAARLREAVYVREIWRLAAPMLVSTLAGFISGHTFVYATAVFLGAAEVGGISAVRNLLGPLLVLMMALENGVTREAVLRHARKPEELRPFMRKVAMNWLVCFLLYVGLVTMFSNEILGLVYGAEFQQYHHLVIWLGVASIMQLFSRAKAIQLRTEGDYFAIKSANLTAMWLSIACSVPLVWAFGLIGAMMSVLVQQSAILLFQYAPLRLDERFQIIPVGVR